MHPIFFAHGPSFRKKKQVHHFDSVDVYRLLCKLLDVTPAPNNGSDQAITLLLQSSDTLLTITAVTCKQLSSIYDIYADCVACALL